MCFLPDLRPLILGGLFSFHLSEYSLRPAELILAWYVSISGFRASGAGEISAHYAPETESLEGLGDSLAKAMWCNTRVAFVFYYLTIKIEILREQRLLAQSGVRIMGGYGITACGAKRPFVV